MSLVPTKYTNDRISSDAEPDEFTQASRYVLVECGYYVEPATGDEVLIEKITQTVQWYGHVLSREEEHWDYVRAGAPPRGYQRLVYGRAYLPIVNPGRALILLEQEEATFHPWTGFQENVANVSSVRRTSGYVVYDANWDHLGLTAAEIQALQDRGLRPDGPPHLVVDSARTWREGVREASIVEKTTSLQVAKWIDPHTVQTELVWDFVDRYDIYDITDVRIRPGPPEISGPRMQRKELYTYRLGVPIDPPTIKARAEDSFVRVEVEGGGASWEGRKIPPTGYKILRRVASEPDRTPSGDPLGRWDSDPAPPARRRILGIVTTTDLTGAPTSPLPGQTPYVEPGDTTEPDHDGWSVIAELSNARPRTDPGYATFNDEDVLNGATYEYAGVAVINEEESSPSRPVQVTYGGSDRSSSIKVRTRLDADGNLEVDVLRPDDPAFPGDDYGETLVLDVPLELTEDLAEEIGERQFLEAAPKMRARAVANLPLLGLRRGQLLRLPAVGLKVTGNQIVIDAETETDLWLVESWRRGARRDGGLLVGQDQTTVELREP